MYIGNGCETTTATVLYSLKIRKGGNTEIYQELARNGEEHGKNSKNLMWICSMEWRGLTGAGELRRSPPFSLDTTG